MKVYFDARMIDHPGIGRYIRCLLPFIAKDKSIDLCLLGKREKIYKFINSRFRFAAPFGCQIIDFDYPIYSLQEQVGFMKLKRIVGDNLLHVPHYNIPVAARFNLVVTIHDLIHILYPKGASGKSAPLYMKFMLNRILKSARAVICVSQATKNEIEKRFIQKKWDSPRRFASQNEARGQSPFHVIYEGVDNVFSKINDIAYLKSVKVKYKLPEKFILYVGSIRRHKNIEGLLDSFERFRKKVPDIWLVMVGKLSQPFDLDRRNVLYLGEVASDADLAAIYNLASCLFNLSLYEGFGLTILEAQKCRLPVLCSDIPAHREVGGDGVLLTSLSYIDPSTSLRVNGECNRTIDQIDENLYNVLFNNGIRERLISKGFENAGRFDWSTSAKDTLGIYRKVWNEGSDSSRLADRYAGRGEDT